MSMRAVRVRITEKRPFLRFAEKRKNGQKSVFRYINTPKWLVPVNYLGKGNFFLLQSGHWVDIIDHNIDHLQNLPQITVLTKLLDY